MKNVITVGRLSQNKLCHSKHPRFYGFTLTCVTYKEDPEINNRINSTCKTLSKGYVCQLSPYL